MGDQYNVTGQVGAVGPNANASNNTFNQSWKNAAAGIDMHALAAELAALRASMLKEAADDVEHREAVASVGAAERAAQKQDGAGALGHLQVAGKWALDVAIKIGAAVAAKAIQTAVGL